MENQIQLKNLAQTDGYRVPFNQSTHADVVNEEMSDRNPQLQTWISLANSIWLKHRNTMGHSYKQSIDSSFSTLKTKVDYKN